MPTKHLSSRKKPSIDTVYLIQNRQLLIFVTVKLQDARSGNSSGSGTERGIRQQKEAPTL